MEQTQKIEDGHRVPNWTRRVLWVGAALFVVALYWSAPDYPTLARAAIANLRRRGRARGSE